MWLLSACTNWGGCQARPRHSCRGAGGEVHSLWISVSQLGHSTLLCRCHRDNSKCSKMKYKRVPHGSSLVSVGTWGSSAQGLVQRKCLGKGRADRGAPSATSAQAGAGNSAERDLRLCVHLRFII